MNRRNINIDIIRICALFFVISIHYNLYNAIYSIQYKGVIKTLIIYLVACAICLVHKKYRGAQLTALSAIISVVYNMVKRKCKKIRIERVSGG